MQVVQVPIRAALKNQIYYHHARNTCFTSIIVSGCYRFSTYNTSREITSTSTTTCIIFTYTIMKIFSWTFYSFSRCLLWSMFCKYTHSHFLKSCWGWSSLHLNDQTYFFSNSRTLPPCAFIYKIFNTPVISTKANLEQSQFIPIIIGSGFQNNFAYSVICGRVNLLKTPLYLPTIRSCSLTAIPHIGS